MSVELSEDEDIAWAVRPNAYLLQERLSKKPYYGDRNIAIIKDADTMTAKAQNRLLKTLEEPHPGTVIILLSKNILNKIFHFFDIFVNIIWILLSNTEPDKISINPFCINF